MAKYTQEFIDAALELSDNEHSKLSERERELFGLSSSRVRALLNNLCTKQDINYLEIGVYRGATLLSALYGNPSVKAVGIDHFKYDEREAKRWAVEGTIWENVKSQLEANIVRYKDPNMQVSTDNITIIADDFKQVAWDKQAKFDVCFFDVTPVTKADYEFFFSTVLPTIKTSGIVIFSNYSNETTSKALNEVIEAYTGPYSIDWKRQRISSGLSDATKYYSGLLILGISKKIKTLG